MSHPNPQHDQSNVYPEDGYSEETIGDKLNQDIKALHKAYLKLVKLLEESPSSSKNNAF